MRQLQVVGLADDTTGVILEDPVRHERFFVASDERLRAASRGDVRRLGQMDIETTSSMRPKDIQARVRAGETPDEVASTTGVSAAHVERFAYPVLVERARVAELAGRAHPVREDGPDPRTLADIVGATLAARGQDIDEAAWDAWKPEQQRGWTVSLSWRAGRSDNVAHWTFRPGPNGGAVDAVDDAARDLGSGAEAPSGPRRSDGRAARSDGISEIADATRTRPEGQQGPDGAPQSAEESHQEEIELPEPMVVGGEHLRPAAAPSSGAGSSAGGSASTPAGAGARRSSWDAESPAAARSGSANPDTGTAPSAKAATPPKPASTQAAGGSAAGTTAVPEQGRSADATEPARTADAAKAERPRPGEQTRTDRTEQARPDQTRAEQAQSEQAGGEQARGEQAVPEQGGESSGARRGRQQRHPIVPSWEDVLLGVRSPKE